MRSSFSDTVRQGLSNGSRPSKGGRVFRFLRLPGRDRQQRLIVGVLAFALDTFSCSNCVARRRGQVCPVKDIEAVILVGMSLGFGAETREFTFSDNLEVLAAFLLVVVRPGPKA